MLEKIHQELIYIIRGVSQAAMYIIIWDILEIALYKYNKVQRLKILAILLMVMFIISGRTFKFL